MSGLEQESVDSVTYGTGIFAQRQAKLGVKEYVKGILGMGLLEERLPPPMPVSGDLK